MTTQNTIVDISGKMDKSIAHNTRVHFDDVEDEQLVFVYACDDKRLKKFKQYGIQTTNKQIVDSVKHFWKIKIRTSLSPQDEIGVYGVNILRAITKYSLKRIDTEREKGSEIYGDWCSDIVLFYCWRKVMENKDIPVCFLTESLDS